MNENDNTPPPVPEPFPGHDLATEPAPPLAAYEPVPVAPRPYNDDEPDTATETPEAKREQP